MAYAGIPYQVFGERVGALAFTIAWSRLARARSGSGISAIFASTSLSPSALLFALRFLLQLSRALLHRGSFVLRKSLLRRDLLCAHRCPPVQAFSAPCRLLPSSQPSAETVCARMASRGTFPVGSLDAVAGFLEPEQPRAGDLPASASPCSSGNIGSAVPWITSVGTAIEDSGRRGARPPAEQVVVLRRPRCRARARRRGGRARVSQPRRTGARLLPACARSRPGTRSPIARPTSPRPRSTRTA